VARYTDSFDKVIGYFNCVTKETFEYKGTHYKPKTLRVSPDVVRGFTCPSHCGGCCPKFSLDYVPADRPKHHATTPRTVIFNGKAHLIFSDLQQDNNNHHCRNLNMSDGRCGIHKERPMSCDFELLRFMTTQDSDAPNKLNQQLFTRGWNLLRIDGDRGALCEMLPPDEDTIDDTIRRLRRLQDWSNHFNLDTKIDDIIEWINDEERRKEALIV